MTGADDSFSTSKPTSTGSKFVGNVFEHPRLTATDAASIRVFLRSFDQFVNEVTERAKQLVNTDVPSAEIVSPVSLKFCIDPEWLESLIALDFIPGARSVESLSDNKLRSYLDGKAKESKVVVTLETLDELVSKNLRTNMADTNAKSRIENLFVAYHGLLRLYGLSWILEDNPKIGVYHVLSASRPQNLRNRLQSDLDFSHHELRKDFREFMAHAVKLSKAWQLVDNGKPSKDGSDNKKHHKKRGGNNNGSSGPSSSSSKSPDKSNKEAPVCLYGPQKERGLRNFLKDCHACPDDEKKILFKQLAEEKAKTGPASSTRSKTGASKATSSSTVTSTTGRLAPTPTQFDSPSISVTVSDGISSLTANGRTDDGSDESIVSSKLAEKAVLQGIGKLTKIDKVKLQVTLKEGESAEKFSFSRTWTPPRIIFQLAAGPLALVNVTFLVADADLAAEELLVGLPVLQHLGVDTKTLLEEKRDVLDGIDCSSVRNSTAVSRGGYISRLMVSRLNNLTSPDGTDKSDSDNRPRVNYYDIRQEEDPFPDPSLLDPLDNDQHQEVLDGIKDMIQTAIDNGFPSEKPPELREIISDHTDIFRVSFSSGPPAKLPPLKIDLMPNATPARVRLRNYSQEQRTFLLRFVAHLVKCEMAYPNPNSPWASAPLLAHKPGPVSFRFTVDLRPVNRYTIKHQFPMPILDQELSKASKSKHFFNVDFVASYWQLLLEKSSQVSQSFITPDGIFTPTRVLHGSTSAIHHLQSSLGEALPTELNQVLLRWLDDILGHGKTVDELLSRLRKFFSFCLDVNFKLHPAKCVLYSTSFRWCGRIISADGIRFDPRRIDGIRQMESPTSGSDLQQFVCAMQWMRNGIPSFSSIIRPLADFLEKVYQHAGKRTKRSVASVQLSKIGWSQIEEDAFVTCKKALEHQATLAHRDTNQRLCVYTDASNILWSGIATQVPPSDLAKPHVDQRHSPLAFLSGHFTGSQLRWSTLKKEAFAIMATTERMHWILATPDGFDLYTDHQNLIFLFDPLAVVPDLSQTSIRKVLRWAVRLSVYNYTCVHIKGVDNVWADLLGRWSSPPLVRRLVNIPILPSSSSDEFIWPSSAELQVEQTNHAASRPPNLIFVDGLWKNPSHAVWVPEDSSNIQLRLCIIAHTGPSGHRGSKSTELALRKYFFWQTVAIDVRTFVRSCPHCLATTEGEKVPRPFGHAFHGTAPNDLLQFDYVEIAPSTSGEKHVLMLRDDHSDYKWFFACHNLTAQTAANAIIDWCAAFGVPKSLMSDGQTHFKNETLRLVSKGLEVPHHFTLPYCPWSNGAVERLGKKLFRVFRCVVSELQMHTSEWPDLLPLVQSALNNAASPQR